MELFIVCFSDNNINCT